MVARFESDRQPLAKIDHLDVASVLDAASTETDQILQIVQIKAPC